MSLRTRIAAVAGVAVAVAVIGAAVFVYVGVRSQLRGEVDDALRARAAPVARPRPPQPEPGRMSRAVSNLLDNASRWSPAGGLVEVALQGGTLTIRDHGPGFEERDLPHVFERFYRSERARSMAGSGLGLAIVRQAAEAHGGFVEARNAPGGGALLRVGFGAPLDVRESSEIGSLDHQT